MSVTSFFVSGVILGIFENFFFQMPSVCFVSGKIMGFIIARLLEILIDWLFASD